MWVCPKCKREFAKMNQGHYCGKAPETVDEYIEQQDPEAKEHTAEVREIILRSIPELKEKIAWSMPVFEKNGKRISFAACKKSISLYLDADILEISKPEFEGFTIKKNAVYLPYNKKIPAEAIEKAVRIFFED